MALLEDIETFLTNAGVTAGWTLYKSVMPPSPDKVIALFETGGWMPQTASDFPVLTFQVRVRAEEFGYAAARAKMEAILHALHNANITGYVYCFAMQSAPNFLGYDQQGNRPDLSLNFRLMRKQF